MKVQIHDSMKHLGVGLAIVVISSSTAVAELGVGEKQNDGKVHQISVKKSNIRKVFAGKKYFYVDINRKNHPVIGLADFDSSMKTMTYREVIGGKQRGEYDITLQKKGFLLEGDRKYSVKIVRLGKYIIVTKNKHFIRFYKNKNAARRYLTSLGYDVTPPKIELNGLSTMTAEQYHLFTDPGAKAIDDIDGKVEVKIYGKVNPDKEGSYVIKYTARDSSGNKSIKKRIVKVVPTDDNIWIATNTSELRQALQDSALNDRGDIIFLDKGFYSTQDDGMGTFIVNDPDEGQSLVIRAKEGLDSKSVILDGNGSNSIISIARETKVEVEIVNITFQNGHAVEGNDFYDDYGGAVKLLHYGTLKVSGCAFKKNISNYAGGAIYSKGRLYIYDSSFIGNKALKDGGSISALTNYSGVLYVKKSTFENNTAERYGGAIHGDQGAITAIDSSFIKNTAPYGGAIYASYAMVDKSYFVENNASRGGAIYAPSHVYRSKFIKNSAYFGAAIQSGYAGENKLNIVDRSLFRGNIMLPTSEYYEHHSPQYYDEEEQGVVKSNMVTNSVFYKNITIDPGDSEMPLLFCEYLANSTIMENSDRAVTLELGLNNVFSENDNFKLKTYYLFNSYIESSEIDMSYQPLIKNILKPSDVGGLDFRNIFIPKGGSPVIGKGIAISDPYFDKVMDIAHINTYEGYVDEFKKLLSKDYFSRPRIDEADVGAVEYIKRKR